MLDNYWSFLFLAKSGAQSAEPIVVSIVHDQKKVRSRADTNLLELLQALCDAR